ncbi:MAG TPA: hypothetical protein VFX85_12305 [Solirubrobacterales bacterium]|nr:hypothetical protein [Solirubrobacterales bacterium]
MNAALEVIAHGVFWLWLLALLPVAVISVLKDRLLMFAGGWLTLGITWFIAALWRADDGTSRWALH